MSIFLSACIALAAPQQTDFLQLNSVHGSGDVQALAVSDDQTRAYVGEGAQVSILDLSNLLSPVSGAEPWDHPAVIAKVPVDATIVNLMLHSTATDPALFIAGGSFGLLHMDISGTGSGCGCGTLGVSSGCFPVTVMDDADRTQSSPAGKNEKWCWDVAMTEVPPNKLVLALFSAQEDASATAGTISELRVYRRGTLAHLQTRALPTSAGGRAYSVVGDGTHVYIAMGTAGIWEADLSTLPFGWTQRIDFDPTSLPSGISSAPTGLTITPSEHGRVMDLDLHNGVLYAAVDRWGLMAIDPSTWTVTDDIPLQVPGGARSHALHVDAETIPGGATYVVCGGGGCGLGAGEGAPYSNYGRMSYGFGVGGETATCSSAAEAMFVFEQGSSLTLDSYKTGSSTNGGNFVARPVGSDLFVYEQPAHFSGAGLSGYPAAVLGFTFIPAGSPPASFSPTYEWAYAGRGLGVFGAFTSLINPSLCIETAEGASGCAADSQYYDLADPDCPVEFTTPSLTGVPGIWPAEAQWIDPNDSSREWFWTSFVRNVTSSYTEYGWRVSTLVSGTPCSLDGWNLARPYSPECIANRTVYCPSTMYDDAVESTPSVLALRGETPWGAVIYDRQRVSDMAAAQTPECFVFNTDGCDAPDLCSTSSYDSNAVYRAQILTHPEPWTPGTLPKPLTFKAKVFSATLPGGSQDHSIAAIAGGFNVDPTDSNYTCAALVLADLSETPTSIDDCKTCPKPTPTIQPLAVAYAPFTHGNAVSVDLATICGRRYAFVADFGGRVLLFDIEDPTNPFYVSAWELPLDTLDGHYDNVIDVMYDPPGESGDHRVYFTSFRPGLVRLTLTVDCEGEEPSISFPATSSWLDADVAKRDTPGLAHLMTVRDVSGNEGLLVGDKNCGLRLYGDWATGSSPNCH